MPDEVSFKISGIQKFSLMRKKYPSQSLNITGLKDQAKVVGCCDCLNFYLSRHIIYMLTTIYICNMTVSTYPLTVRLNFISKLNIIIIYLVIFLIPVLYLV